MRLDQMPSSARHEPGCEFDLLKTDPADFRQQHLEAATVQSYTTKLKADPNTTISSESFVNEHILRQNEVALACARRIVAGECPLFRARKNGEIAPNLHSV